MDILEAASVDLFAEDAWFQKKKEILFWMQQGRKKESFMFPFGLNYFRGADGLAGSEASVRR